jgi:hypothetical protein
MLIFEVNYFAVLLSTLLGMCIGFFWYHKKVFGLIWIRLVGLTPKKVKETSQDQMAVAMGSALINSFLVSFVIANLIVLLEVPHVVFALQIGLVFWLTFVFSTQFTQALYAKKDQRLVLIETGKDLIFYLLSSALLFFLH